MLNQHKVLCAFPIFAPSEYYLKVNLESIKSFFEYIKKQPNHSEILDIRYAGWALNDEYWEQIEIFIKANLPAAKVFRLDKNYGKSFIVNKIAFDYYKENPECQYMFTMDSDIRFIETERDFFSRLAVCSELLEKNLHKKVGLIALNQAIENCHIFPDMDQTVSYVIQPSNISEEVVWSTLNRGGIAGGCLWLDFQGFIKFKGYNYFVFPYGGDDAFVELSYRQNNYITCIIKSLSVEHPITVANAEYIQWKQTVIKDFGIPFDEKIYLNNVESSMKFWDELNKKEKEK